MKRAITVIILTAGIIGLAIWEIVFINGTIKTMNEECSAIYDYIQEEYTYDNLLERVDNVENYWEKREKTLCLIVSHKDMANIGDYIEFLKASVINENKDDIQTYALLLKENMKYLGHLISFNVENIF